MAALMVRQNVLALTVRIGMCLFLCLNKNEMPFVFLLKALLHFR